MLGTWGLRSINSNTFNQASWDSLAYPKIARDVIYTGLKVRNVLLNLLGYLPATRRISGCVRIAIGVGMLATVAAVGDRRARRGMIIGRFYDEAVGQAMGQIARGILEAFVPYGNVVNGILDVSGTVYNISHEFFYDDSSLEDDDVFYRGAHPNPDYPFPVNILHLV